MPSITVTPGRFSCALGVTRTPNVNGITITGFDNVRGQFSVSEVRHGLRHPGNPPSACRRSVPGDARKAVGTTGWRPLAIDCVEARLVAEGESSWSGLAQNVTPRRSPLSNLRLQRTTGSASRS
jgi:hypothetical protein